MPWPTKARTTEHPALRERLNRRADVAEAGSVANLTDADFERATSGLGDVTSLFRRLPDIERGRGVAVKPFVDRGDVDVDDVAVFQPLRVGDSVADDALIEVHTLFGNPW